MEIIDLSEKEEGTYFLCLENWSEEIKEAGPHKENWYRGVKEKGLRVKLARSEDGKICGMIQYLPIEESFVEGKDLYVVYCIWVHGYKQGVGNQQKKGIGKALLAAAEQDVRDLGAKGLAAWGVSVPFFMRASWFRKQGYRKVDNIGMQILLWKPFTSDAVPPVWIRQKKTPPKVPRKVQVSAFRLGWCPAQNLVFERAKRGAAEFGNKVDFQEYDKLKKIISKKARKLKRAIR
ncbi:MAG: GNAT family N-acetyltransferase [Spirochaetales bacterium]|nr:GNAT family N-acetyltransferase [Spirochaetales bacterium]